MILFVSVDDWANVGYVFAECLKRVGVEACAVKLNEHSFAYENSALTVRKDDLQGAIDSADTVVLMHSNPLLLTMELDYSDKRLAVFHGGSQYRNEPEFLSRLFNAVVDVSLTQTGDLLDLGAKNEHWVMPCIDTDKYVADFTPQNKLTFAHFPTSPLTKGTYLIDRVMRDFNVCYLQSTYNVSSKENIERIKKCDVYIDAVQPVLNGKKYGEWGVAALEAAALGKVVMSHFLSRDRYTEQFGYCPIRPINGEEDLRSELTKLIINFAAADNSFLDEIRHKSREWVEKNHSYEATGERLKSILGG